MGSILNYMHNKNVIHNDDGSITIVNKKEFLNYIRINVEGLDLSNEIKIIVLEAKTFGILLNDNKRVLCYNKEIGNVELLSFISVKKIFPKAYIGNFILKKAEHHELADGDIILTIHDFRLDEPEDGKDELDVINKLGIVLSNYDIVVRSTSKQSVFIEEDSNEIINRSYHDDYTYKLTEI